MKMGIGFNLRRRSSGPASPPLTMQNTAGTTVTDLGSSEWLITKTAVDNWGNGSGTSVQGFAGSFIMRFEPTFIGDAMIGMNSDPLTDNSYQSLDYGLLFNGNGSGVTLYEGTTPNIFPGVGYAVGDHFFIKRSGSAMSFGYGGNDGVTGYTEVFTRTDSAVLYVDSALYYQNSSIKVKRIA